MRLYQHGREDAFNILYRRYSRRMYGFLRKRLKNPQSCSDVFQATFVKLHRSRHQFNSSFAFAPWLFTIARTSAIDFFDKNLALESILSENEILREIPAEVPSLDLVELSALPETQRTAIEMRYLKEMEFEEIAKRLETSPANVRKIISRGLKQLRSIFLIKETP